MVDAPALVPCRPPCPRAFLALACASLLALACGESGPEGSAAPPSARPNLLILSVDTLRADRVGAYGHPEAETPTLDRLVREGTVFTDAWTPIPRTTQAFASLFTSTHPHEHGALEVGEPMRPGVPTLAEILGREGYATAAVTANAVAGPRQGLDRGFERFVDRGALTRFGAIRRDFRKPASREIGWAEAVNRAALHLLEERDARPFFLWLLYFDPHWLYDPPAPHRDVVDWGTFTYYRDFLRFRPRNATAYFNLNGRSERDRPQLSRLYDAEIRYTDERMGALLDALAGQGLLENTLVVFTSDHGESLGEHGYYYEHGDFVYQTTLHVPLAFRWPGRVPDGRRVAEPVSLLDVVPTVLALLGVDPPTDASLRGRDLSPALAAESRALPKRVLFAESGAALLPQNPYRPIGGSRRALDGTYRYLRSGRWVIAQHRGATEPALYDAEADPGLLRDVRDAHPEVHARLGALLEATPLRSGRWRAAREGRWKLIRIPEPGGRARHLLYDLEADPGELRDRASEEPEVAARLARRLDAFLAEIPSEGGNPRETPPAELLEQLRELGYVE